MSFPPGHQPGFHVPGTLIPIGAAIQQQEQEARDQARRAALLLLMSR